MVQMHVKIFSSHLVTFTFQQIVAEYPKPKYLNFFFFNLATSGLSRGMGGLFLVVHRLS